MKTILILILSLSAFAAHARERMSPQMDLDITKMSDAELGCYAQCASDLVFHTCYGPCMAPYKNGALKSGAAAISFEEVARGASCPQVSRLKDLLYRESQNPKKRDRATKLYRSLDLHNACSPATISAEQSPATAS